MCIAAPETTESHSQGRLQVEGYESGPPPSSPHFAPWRPNAHAMRGLCRIIDRFDPDLVYDVHGPSWAVGAAMEKHLPVVSMMGDYNWYCRRTFLVDSMLKRCSGPESTSKCFKCINRGAPLGRRVVRWALRQAALAGLPRPLPGVRRLEPHRLWSSLEESHAYARHLHAMVDCFVVGDRNAEMFLLGHGIPAAKVTSIPQCLPSDALVSRRSPGKQGSPVIDRPMRIGFVGRPHFDKGIHVLARAFDALPRGTPAELWIVHATLGTPEFVEPMFPDAARFRAQLASGRIRLFRPTGNEALYQLMADIDLGVVPSLQFESPSLALLEFVAQGTPIVRSASAGMDHVIQDGINGRTFPYGDWEALRNLLLDIVDDPALLERWRRRLPKIGHDAEYAGKLIDLFAAIVSRSERPRRQAVHG